jgi:nitroreductase
MLDCGRFSTCAGMAESGWGRYTFAPEMRLGKKEAPHMTKTATTDHPIIAHIAERWSPRAFDEQMISEDELMSLFEAARWAASAFNAQPWRFVYACRGEPEFDTLAACLRDSNAAWARNAAVLMVASAKSTHEDGSPNGHAVHDLGQAMAMLSVEAMARGIYLHQMAGFYPDKARELLGVPEGFEPKTAAALGYLGDPASLPEKLAEREAAPRVRKPIAELAFKGRWPK